MINPYIKRAFSDLKRNLMTQMMTTAVVALSVLIFIFFYFIYLNLQHVAEIFGAELGPVVFLKKDVPAGRIPDIYQKLIKLPGVEAVNYVSPEDAMNRLKTFLKDEKDVLEGVDPDFLPPSFELKITPAFRDIGNISSMAGRIDKWPEVYSVRYGQEWIGGLEAFIRVFRIIVVISAFFLLLTAAFVVSSTIRLALYARKEEIEILHLVGATRMFIQTPFIIQAFSQGLVGSSMAAGIVFFCYLYIKNIVAQFTLLGGIGLYFLPWPHIVSIIAISACVCAVWTAFVIRKSLVQ